LPYYDPDIGLFTQPDWWEVTTPGVGTNRYSYSFNDPVNLMDPGGNGAVWVDTDGDGLLETEIQIPPGSAENQLLDCNCSDGTDVALEVGKKAKSFATQAGNSGFDNFSYHGNGVFTGDNNGVTVAFFVNSPSVIQMPNGSLIDGRIFDDPFAIANLHLAGGLETDNILAVPLLLQDDTRVGRSGGGGGGGGLSYQALRAAMTSAAGLYKGSTVAGHSLSKHAGRNPEIWGKLTGASSTWHDQVIKHAREIIRGPGSFSVIKNRGGTQFREKRLPDGRGIRLNMDNTFKGFID